jgi:hypothetical protein
MQTTKFERGCKIQRVLDLLSDTAVPGAWCPSPAGFDITYSRERLERWPLAGDLATINAGLYIYELDEDNNLHDTSDSNESRDDSGNVAGEGILRNDGTDSGPAPLQNAEAPDKEFETEVNFGLGNMASTSIHTTAAVTGRVEAMCADQNVVEQQIRFPIQHRFSNDTATFDQPSVLRTNGFVDMS